MRTSNTNEKNVKNTEKEINRSGLNLHTGRIAEYHVVRAANTIKTIITITNALSGSHAFEQAHYAAEWQDRRLPHIRHYTTVTSCTNAMRRADREKHGEIIVIFFAGAQLPARLVLRARRSRCYRAG